MHQQLFDVFLSYAHHDRDRAQAVRELLGRNGIRCWMSQEQMRSGTWDSQVAWALQHARQFVLLGTARSYRSIHVRNELVEAMKRGSEFLHHLVLEQANAPDEMRLHLNVVQSIEAFGTDWADILESSLVPVLVARLALPRKEHEERLKLQELGLVRSAIIHQIEQTALAASEAVFYEEMMSAEHRSRVSKRFGLGGTRKDKLVAVFDASRELDGTASTAFLDQQLAWHSLGSQRTNAMDWRTIDTAKPAKREYDGSWRVDIHERSGGINAITIHCQTDAFAEAFAQLIREVAKAANPSHKAIGSRRNNEPTH
jgi:TIR domain